MKNNTDASKDAPESDSEFSSDGNEYFLPHSTKSRRLPEWLDHFNQRDLKILFKCSAAVWIMTLLVVINPTLKVIGQATFFGVIVIVISPPSGVVFVGVMGASTIAIGICLGWAWGVITMKTALSTRPAADLQRQYAALQEAATRNTTNTLQASGQATFTQVAIFEGFMLDTRVTVTYFCMLGLFIYLIARLRVAAPKLALVQVFSIIVTDIFLTIGPLIPTFSGTIPQVLIVPTAIAIGISLACNLLFFPRSTSSLVMEDMAKLLRPMDSFLGACSLHFEDPARKMDLTRLKGTKSKTIGTFKALEGNLKFLAMDVSVCRWSAGDVKSLHEPLRNTMVAFLSLAQVQIARLEFQLKDAKLLELAESTNDGQNGAGHHQFARAFDLRQQYRDAHGDVHRTDTIKSFAETSKPLMGSVRDALQSIGQALEECNDRRWFGRMSAADCDVLYKSHEETLVNLHQHQEAFSHQVALQLLGRTRNATNNAEKEDLNDDRKLDGLVYILVIEERLMNLVEAVRVLLEHVVMIEDTRKHVRFWPPNSIKDIVPWALEKGTGDGNEQSVAAKIQLEPKNEKGNRVKKSRGKDAERSSIELLRQAISQPRGARQRSKFGTFVISAWKWFSSIEGLYALRLLIVSMALGSLAANKHTAGFFYREKALWGLIMSQTGMMPYTADFIYGIILRLIGTVIGAVIGLVAWYIGAGDGPGNPYGIAAIMVPVIVVAMWLRLFASPAFLQGIIIATATTYLVVAYSWVDTHIPSYGNPGVGYAVFWRRMLLVIIGFGAAAFVTLFPRPPSANRHYRHILSSALQTSKDQYAFFVSCRRSRTPPTDFRKAVEKTAVEQAEILLGIEPQVKLTKFEFSTSNINANTLSLVCHLCMNLNQYITQLSMHTAGLSEELRERFFQSTGAADERLVADIMAVLTLVQHALKNGDALPAILPVPLMETRVTSMKQKMEEMRIDLAKLDETVLEDQATRQYLSAVSAFVQLLGSIDELVLIVKSAVGETSYIDLEA